jgi:hypothetical protein
MVFLVRMTAAALILLAGHCAFAGKVESVQVAVKTQCDKEINSDEALRLMKDLYLACVPNTKVDVEGLCKITCLKNNTGAVVGQ